VFVYVTGKWRTGDRETIRIAPLRYKSGIKIGANLKRRHKNRRGYENSACLMSESRKARCASARRPTIVHLTVSRDGHSRTVAEPQLAALIAARPGAAPPTG
jgi:hypothetical protein